MMTTATFRLIQASDRERLAAFFTRNQVNAVLETFTAFPLTSETAEMICGQEHKDRYYLYENDGQLLAFSMLRGWDEGYAIPSFGIFVDHNMHGKGVGSLVLERTIDEARKLGCTKVRLSVFASNPAAFHIYQKAGFREHERSQIVHNELHDEKIIMVKELS